MPWRTSVESKREFVELATKSGANVRELCRRFGIGRTAGHRLLRRFQQEGEAAFAPRSRRPHKSPSKTLKRLEKAILRLRDETHWGARKLQVVLAIENEIVVPRTTIHNILKRNERIDPQDSSTHQPFIRFEHPEPNDLWQMDFKGSFEVGTGRCHSLTVLDDHARYSLCLQACSNETTQTVERRLTTVFETYGLPWRMTMDNGSPWGDSGENRMTKLAVWLIRLGIAVSHSRPYHPQTQGKDERFHKTLDDELLKWQTFRSLPQVQEAFDLFRDQYNFRRPHESLGMATPSSRYRMSLRSMPSRLPSIEYASTDLVRVVEKNGDIELKRIRVHIGKAFVALPVAFRPTLQERVYDVYFCAQLLGQVDFRVERKTATRRCRTTRGHKSSPATRSGSK